MKKMNGWFPKKETCVILFSDNRSIFPLGFFSFHLLIFIVSQLTHESIYYATHRYVFIVPWCLTTKTAKNMGKHYSLQTTKLCLLLVDGSTIWCLWSDWTLRKCWTWWNLMWKTLLTSNLVLKDTEFNGNWFL